MKRLLFSCTILLLAGIYLNYYLSADITAVILITAVISGVIKTIRARGSYMKIAACFLSFSLIMGLSIIPLYEYSHNHNFHIGEIYNLKLRVTEPPEINADYSSCVCDITEIWENGKFCQSKAKIRLTYSLGENLLSFGDTFTASCKITTPSAPLNRGAFDYGFYLKTKNIFTTATITKIHDTVSENNFTFIDRFTLLNIRLCEKIDENFNEKDALFLKAVLLGNKTDMPSSFYSELKRSGLSHIAAVSGMHLSYIVLLISAFFRPSEKKKRSFSFIIIIFSISFMLLTGLSPSVVRATIMICCIYSGNLFSRRSDPLTSLGLAALIIVTNNPYVAFSSSFLLSFSATAGILFISSPLETIILLPFAKIKKKLILKPIKYILTIICVSVSAQVFTLPFMLSIFGELSLWTLPANLLVSPFLPCILGIGFIFCLLSYLHIPFSIYVAKLLSMFVSPVRCIIKFFGNLEYGILYFQSIVPIFIFTYIIFLIVILLFLLKRRGYIAYPLAILFVCIIFVTASHLTSQDTAEIRFINVGQGDSTLIRLPLNITILIDGGFSYMEDDSSVINSYLMQNGIKHINFMVATHSNSDHTRGLISVINTCKVDTLIIPPSFTDDTLIKTARENNTEIRTMVTGDLISFSDNIVLTALNPDAQNIGQLSQNNSSLALRLDYFNTSFLFMGDIEQSTERYMTRHLSDTILDADVLKVSHHGSNTSTTEELLKAVTPDFAVISVGENYFGHPSDDVLARLSAADATVFRTDLHKDIIFLLTSEGISNIIYN